MALTFLSGPPRPHSGTWGQDKGVLSFRGPQPYAHNRQACDCGQKQHQKQEQVFMPPSGSCLLACTPLLHEMCCCMLAGHATSKRH